VNSQPSATGTPAPVTAGAIVWYKSPQYLLAMTVVVGGALAFFPKLSKLLSAANMSVVDFAELIGAGLTLVGGGVAWILRQIGKIQPITFTQKAADSDPSTIAVVQTQAKMAAAGIPTAVTLQAQITKDAKS
jgi:hypothetical protein